MDAELAHHGGALGFVLVGLDLPLELLGVVVGFLVGLRERVVVDVAIAVVAEPAEVGLRALLLLNGHRYNFYL